MKTITIKNILALLLTGILFTACTKTNQSVPLTDDVIQAEFQFEIAELDNQEAVIIHDEVSPATANHMVYKNLKMGINKVTFPLKKKKGIIYLSVLNKDGIYSLIDQTVYNVEQ